MSDDFLCLNCWRSLSALDAVAECPACSAPGAQPWMRALGGPLRGRDFRSSWWRRLFADETLSCADHPEAGLKLSCECGAPLGKASSLRLAPGRRFAMGLVGPPWSGKTLLLAAMVQALNRRREPAIGLMGVDGTEARFQPLLDKVFQQRRRPDATAKADDLHRHYAWEVLVGGPSRARRARMLAVYDAAGEVWEATDLKGADEESLERYLGYLGSVALLIDGAALAEDLGLPSGDAWGGSRSVARESAEAGRRDGEILARLIERLGPASRQVRIALLITKADQLWDHPEYAALRPDEATGVAPPQAAAGREALLRELLRLSGRQPLLLAAEKHFRQVALFATSGIGFRPAAEQVADGRLLVPLEPRGVVEPLLWLLDLRTTP